MGVYEGSPLHSLKMNTSEMEVSVQYRNASGFEDVFHLPLKNLKKMGKMYNHGSISIFYQISFINQMLQEITIFHFAWNWIKMAT